MEHPEVKNQISLWKSDLNDTNLQMPRLTALNVIICTCSVYLQFLTLGSSLWLPWRPLQPEVYYDCWFDYVDLNVLLLLFRHRIGKRRSQLCCLCFTLSYISTLVIAASGLTRKYTYVNN